MKNWIKILIITFLSMVVIGLCCVPFIWNNCFFEKHTTIAEKLKYVGAFIGGILVAINAYFIYKRQKEQNRSNNLVIEGQKLVAKGQLDTRFKDAATLLASGNTSAELSGIHALNQIAIEASKTEDQQDYVKVIKDILIAFVKENSVIEYEIECKTDRKGTILFDECYDPIEKKSVKKAYNTKNRIVLQTVIDKLFKDNGYDIYARYPTDLSKTVLKEIYFEEVLLQDVDFKNAQLQGTKFYKTQIQDVDFRNAQLQGAIFQDAVFQDVDFDEEANLQNTIFWNTKLEKVFFKNSQLQGAEFKNSQLQDVTFYEAQLQEAMFLRVQTQNTEFCQAQVQGTCFIKTHLQDTNFRRSKNIDKAVFEDIFWNEETNFTKTSFENKTIEELTKIMGNPPTPINK